MKSCWVPSIRVRCCSLLLLALGSAATAQTLESLAQAYRKAPTAAGRAALAQYATAHSKDESGALALLSLGATDLDNRDYDSAQKALKQAEKRLTKLSDYVSCFRAGADFELHDYDSALKQLDGVWKSAPKSPLIPRAVTIAVRSLTEKQKYPEAMQLVRDHYSELADSRGDLLLGQVTEAAKDLAAAAAFYQRVYYLNPASKEAGDAETALARIREALGDRFPEAKSDIVLARSFRLMKAGRYDQAKKELEDLVPKLGGADRELARVRLGEVAYFGKDYAQSSKYLKDLGVSDGEADAERIYYIHLNAKKLGNDDEFLETASSLSKKYPQSPWRLEAVLSAANYYLLKNEVASYEPLYRSCMESFPNDAQAPFCQWKVAWSEYLRRGEDTARLMREHLKRYPASEKTTAALYYLGRAAERAKDFGAAKVYYSEIPERFSLSYYAAIARERLKSPPVATAVASAEAREFVASLNIATAARQSFEVSPATRLRIERARMLSDAGLKDWSDQELRFGARTDGQPQLLAMELAKAAQQRGDPGQGIRYIKAYAPNYLNMPFESAPPLFWRLAFPLPYWTALERNAKENALDPYLVAGLIRQESEFDAKVISHANAYGLTQVLPSTGRELSRKVGVKQFSSKMLLMPEVNLKLGTYYLRRLNDSLNARWDATLAAYNAGKTRADRWLSWGNFQESSEFIESIPFNETRTYVQAVLRNAEMYRRLYEGTTPEVLSTDGPATSSAAAKPAGKSGASHKKPSPSSRRHHG